MSGVRGVGKSLPLYGAGWRGWCKQRAAASVLGAEAICDFHAILDSGWNFSVAYQKQELGNREQKAPSLRDSDAWLVSFTPR
jgi:hypothetical protein